MSHWSYDAVFYQIYPLGLCGAPHTNDFSKASTPRLAQLHDWIPHMQSLGINALYLSPLFESSTHGYDTADFYHVDRRLGDRQTLIDLVQALHAAGIRLILDGVFHHVGRHFWAFRDLQTNGPASPYRDWFTGIDFGRRSPHGDPFSYADWDGHSELVKLNLANPDLRTHIFDAVRHWFADYGIDGLRLDVAEQLDPAFIHDLAQVCRECRPDAWLLGEQIHGDYRQLVNPTMLDSATNYEFYKGLYSSHNDRNYFEIAYSLNREFGPQGIYRGAPLYNFADNHDVNRVASTLHNPHHLTPLYALLFTVPGVPSIYYGSEWGLGGTKANDDWPLRPQLDPPPAGQAGSQPRLQAQITRLIQLRHQLTALRHGDYTQLHVDHEQLAFARHAAHQTVIVVVNAAATPARLDLRHNLHDGALHDALDPAYTTHMHNRQLSVEVPPYQARVLVSRTTTSEN
jgi:cyclomaltodextrinase